MIRIRRRHKKSMGLNMTSTSDISFMLLIFFLVTTSMDSDKGLGRQLPPLNPDQKEVVQDVNRDHVLTLHLMKGGRMTMEEKSMNIDDAMRKELRHFIMAKGRRHIIEIQVDRDADYDSYFHLQNQVVMAYTELRNAAAMKLYDRPYGRCSEGQRNEIMKMYPQRIQEVSNNPTTTQTDL